MGDRQRGSTPISDGCITSRHLNSIHFCFSGQDRGTGLYRVSHTRCLPCSLQRWALETPSQASSGGQIQSLEAISLPCFLSLVLRIPDCPCSGLCSFSNGHDWRQVLSTPQTSAPLPPGINEDQPRPVGARPLQEPQSYSILSPPLSFPCLSFPSCKMGNSTQLAH